MSSNKLTEVQSSIYSYNEDEERVRKLGFENKNIIKSLKSKYFLLNTSNLQFKASNLNTLKALNMKFDNDSKHLNKKAFNSVDYQNNDKNPQTQKNLIFSEMFDLVKISKIYFKKNKIYEEETKRQLKQLDKDIKSSEFNLKIKNEELTYLQNQIDSLMIEQDSLNVRYYRQSKEFEKKKKLIKNQVEKLPKDILELKNQFTNMEISYKKMKNNNKIKIEAIYNEKLIKKENELNIIEKRLKSLNHQYNTLKSELILHYHKLLKEGKDYRSEGLSWIIKEIFLMNDDVLESYFPRHLDTKALEFLFDISKLHIKIKITEKNIIELKDKNLIKKPATNESPVKRRQRLFSTIKFTKSTPDYNILFFLSFLYISNNIILVILHYIPFRIDSMLLRLYQLLISY